MPIASPRNEFQKLSEEDMKDETSYVEGPDANANGKFEIPLGEYSLRFTEMKQNYASVDRTIANASYQTRTISY